MPIRVAQESDHAPMAQIGAEAFWDDETFGPLIHPHRDKYPQDMHLYWLRHILRAWPFPHNHFFVSTVQNDGVEKIVGWALWVRKGSEQHEIEANASEPVIELPANRAADSAYEGVLEEAYDCVAENEWSGQRAECWDIGWLAVSPQYQFKGIGKALMQFGMEEAKRESVALSVIAALGKDGFYNKLGYTVRSGKLTDGVDNPLHGKIEGSQFWWKEDHLN